MDKILEEDLVKIAENAPKVYESGYKVGFEEGKAAEYDVLWDSLQDEGRRDNYSSGFYGRYWTDTNFYPRYDMKPTDAYMMFRYNQCTELFDRLNECGVTLDFSECGSLQYCFANIKSTRIGVINASNATNMHHVFYQASHLKKIEKLTVSENTPYQSTTFNGCNALEELIVEGVIGKPNFNVQWSTKLNRTSIESIINALSATTSGLTVTFSKEAVNNAFGIDIDDESTYTEEWNTLRNSKANWTFAYN